MGGRSSRPKPQPVDTSVFTDPNKSTFDIHGYTKEINKVIPSNLIISQSSAVQVSGFLYNAMIAAMNACNSQNLDSCNGFVAYVQNGRAYYRLLRFDPSTVDTQDNTDRTSTVVTYIRGKHIYPGDASTSTTRIEKFRTSTGQTKSANSKNASIETFVSEPLTSRTTADESNAIPITSRLELSLFADDDVEVYRYNTITNVATMIGRRAFEYMKPRQININGTEIPMTDTIVSKIILPDFTNNDSLVFRVRNNGGPGYFIASWVWNNTMYGSSSSTLKTPIMSLVKKGSLWNRFPVDRFISTGQYQGCYADTDTNIPVLTTTLGSARSIEECAVMAYGRIRDNNIQSEYYYGLRNGTCYGSNRIGCANSGKAIVPVSDRECNVILNRNFGESGGKHNTTSVYKLTDKNMQFLSTPVEQMPLSIIPNSVVSRFGANLNTSVAFPVKVSIQNTDRTRTDMGFPDTYLYNNAGNPTRFSNATVGFREFVWSPRPEFRMITRLTACGKPDNTSFMPNLFYDPLTEKSAKDTLRFSSYELTDDACSDTTMTQLNILNQQNKDAVIDEILSAFRKAIYTSSYNEWTYTKTQKMMVRIDDDARLLCVANKDVPNTCALFDTEPTSYDATKTTMCNRDVTGKSQYTPGSWCVSALSGMYGDGAENLRFSGKFKSMILELIHLVNSSPLKDKLSNEIILSEYLSLPNLNDVITEERWDGDDINTMYNRLNTILIAVYTMTNDANSSVPKNDMIVMNKLNKQNSFSNLLFDLYKYARVINGASSS
jgi:hypothetical protein